ncbi:hypothetical protein NKI38_21965 [Mesorhizobium sp. M0621]|uniref:hypothetical protein n=1 Tax=Mesorhizobium sp. M0621 TaxID=2956974 RepID=UPI0033377F47
MSVNRLRRPDKIKFATWVANGQLMCGNAPGHSTNWSRDGQSAQRQQKRRLDWSEAALQFQSSGRDALPLKSSGDEAEARRIHGAGLAGHGVGETLTLESGGQVHFAAGEEACKKLHNHLHLLLRRVAFA